MSEIYALLDEINVIVSQPAQMVKKFKAETGKKAIGCLPVYCPEEIVYAAGLLPIGIWGGQIKLAKSHSYFPAFACSIMQSVMEFALNGVYNDLDAVIIPAPCDTLKSLGQDWISAAPKVKPIHIVHPQMSRIEAGVTYMETELEHVKKEIEAITGEEISEEALNESITVYNQYRKTMREFTEVAKDYPHIISPKVRHMVIKGAYFAEKAKYTSLVQELITELKKQTPVEWTGKKIVLTGIMAEPDSLLDLFGEYYFTVVGDDLTQESRQFRTDVPEGNRALNRLAKQWAAMDHCSLIYDPAKKRGQMLVDMVKATQADGIILCMMKFCDPEEFDYPVLKKEFQTANIPLLYIEIDQQMQSVEQARTRIQGFSEMLTYK